LGSDLVFACSLSVGGIDTLSVGGIVTLGLRPTASIVRKMVDVMKWHFGVTFRLDVQGE
jgi:hypothetical protein